MREREHNVQQDYRWWIAREWSLSHVIMLRAPHMIIQWSVLKGKGCLHYGKCVTRVCVCLCVCVSSLAFGLKIIQSAGWWGGWVSNNNIGGNQKCSTALTVCWLFKFKYMCRISPRFRLLRLNTNKCVGQHRELAENALFNTCCRSGWGTSHALLKTPSSSELWWLNFIDWKDSAQCEI